MSFLSGTSLFNQCNWTVDSQKVPAKILLLLGPEWFRHILTSGTYHLVPGDFGGNAHRGTR